MDKSDDVFVVRYARAEELAPARQGPLVARMRAAGRDKPIGVVFVVGADVRTVDLSVPTFWLGVTNDRALQLAALAVVSPNPAVRVAAAGFGAANALRGVRFRVKGFDDERSARAWATDAVRAAIPAVA